MRSNPQRVALTSLLLALSFATPVAAVEIETAKGVVEIGKTPARVAVFDIAAIDTLSGLGVRIEGVPDNLYLKRLKPVSEQGTVIGNLFEPNLEALSALAPDLIIVGERMAGQLSSVARIAPAIDMTITGSDVIRSASERALSYGKLFNRQAEAAALVAKLDAAAHRAKLAVSGAGKALIVMTSGAKITIYGEGSRFGWIFGELGLEPAIKSEGEGNHGEAVSFELVHKVNPDWLVVIDRAAAIGSGEQSARATLDNELVRETTAWNKGQIVFLPAAELYIADGGIESTVIVLDEISKAFASKP